MFHILSLLACQIYWVGQYVVLAPLAGAVAIPLDPAGRGAAAWSRAAGPGTRWGPGRHLEEVSMRMFLIALVAIFGFGVGVGTLVGVVSGAGTVSVALGLLWISSTLVAGAHSGMGS